jgi:hypothetical protein
MQHRRHLTVVIAAAGLLTVVLGVHAELLHARPMYDVTVETGWGHLDGHPLWIHSLNHEERLLASLSGVGLLGSVVATRWRPAAAMPAASGVIVVFYPVRAVVRWASSPQFGIYTGIPGVGNPSGRFVLGAEPYLLVVGGLCLVGAGLVGWRAATPQRRSDDDAGSTLSS